MELDADLPIPTPHPALAHGDAPTSTLRVAHQLLIRAVSWDEWEVLMQSGQGDWMRLDVEPCDGDFLIVERAGLLLAYLQHHRHEVHSDWHVLERCETRPYYRRRGYAQMLVEMVIAETGAALIIARGVLKASVGFWQHLGFEPDGYGPDFDEDEGHYIWTSGKTSQWTHPAGSTHMRGG